MTNNDFRALHERLPLNRSIVVMNAAVVQHIFQQKANTNSLAEFVSRFLSNDFTTANVLKLSSVKQNVA